MKQAFALTGKFWQALSTRRLHAELGDAGVIALLKLLSWAAENRPNGHLKNLNINDVELVAEWNGEPGKFGAVAEMAGCLLLWEDEGVAHYGCAPWDEYMER